jgi:hypothetical protein
MCCLPEMTLLDKENDKTLGTIKLNCNLCPQIDVSVYDEDGDLRFNIKSDCCPTAMVCKGTICGLCCQELEIPVYNESGKEVAYIKKKFRSCGAGFTDADTFLCKFKADLSTREKALLMGTCFMIDFCYFEDSPDDKNND